MPPRRILKSGNDGNSQRAATSDPDAEKPLFPLGSKYPLSLLHERCSPFALSTKLPLLRAFRSGRALSVASCACTCPSFRSLPLLGAVTAIRTRKSRTTFVASQRAPKDSFGARKTAGKNPLLTFDNSLNKNSHLSFEPHPPYTRPTAIEARHWGATYALYRFCNGIQLNRVLPPGPREYWGDLAAEHNIIPEHQKWMYDSDPFVAARMVKERQEKVAKRKEEEYTETGGNQVHVSTSVSKEYVNAPEIKMASALRDLVEEAIKKTVSLHPGVGDAVPLVIDNDDIPALLSQLLSLGFTHDQSQKAIDLLSNTSPFTSDLLSTLSPLEACIEYLVLHVPECDLPQRFMPSINSSNPFITGAHSGTDDLKKRWLEERLVKEGGWPSHIVKEALGSNPSLANDQASLVAALDKWLLGKDDDVVAKDGEVEELKIDTDEIESLGGSFVEPGHLVVPLPMSPFKLHIFLPSESVVPSYGPPMYISSDSVPAYIRLHLLAAVLNIADVSLKDPHESFLGVCVRIIEEGWVDIEDNGPPNVSEVLRYLMLRRKTSFEESEVSQVPVSKKKVTQRRRQRQDDRTDVQIKSEFEVVCRNDKYRELLDVRRTLPAFSSKDNFLSTLEKNRVVVVVGETGSGKTTQLPQFILDSLIFSDRGTSASILVTQPRRLSAISVAARVSEERLSDGSVGYAIRGENKQNARTKLLFCTTGVVLRRISSGDNLEGVTHIVVDEVHERSVDGDFLLLELKDILSKNRDLKVVLMSATINQETFVRYFNGAPLIRIPGLTHPVEDLYLEDFIPLVGYRPQSVRVAKMPDEERHALQQELQGRGVDESSIMAIQNISRSEWLDYQLISAVVGHIVAVKPRGGILIFLPGVQEIRKCTQLLSLDLASRAEIMPLHANLTSDEQRTVFRATQRWKIVVATNVAETSVTIDDIVYIIDSGKMKGTQYDPDSGITRLVETWTSRAAGRQRRGRAGRTQPGVCYKLYTRQQERIMAEFPVPEILRVPLDNILLAVNVAKGRDAKAFLSKAIDPPKLSTIDNAWEVLKELGAVGEDDKITALGRHMAMLPVDLRIAKMMILGTIFQCLNPILTVAACLSSKPLFLNPLDKREEASAARLRFETGGSDLLTDVNAYEQCAKLRSEGKSPSSIKSFCDENFISVSSIRNITSLRHDLFSNLAETGFVPLSLKADDVSLNANSANLNLVKAVILGGLWPRVARVYLPKSAIKFDKIQAGTIQRENLAKEFKLFDLKEGRVFLHPTSVLFGESTWKSPFLVYFNKQATSKVFLRDATQVPTYALLLFGGSVSVNHVAGGLTVGGSLKLKAWPRIGVLVNQLCRLLDAELESSIEQGTLIAQSSLIVKAMLELVTGDGLTLR